MNNPYSPPQAAIHDAGLEASNLSNEDARRLEHRLEQMRTGQRLVIWAILLYFGLGAVSALSGQLRDQLAATLLVGFLLLCLLAMLVLSTVGMFKLWAGLGTHVVLRIVLFVLMFVPLVGLLILVSSSARATKRLRAHGYRVGLLGAAPLARPAR